MRSLWLGTAALLMSTGFALAQTATTAPAPTGTPNGPVQTAPGASPGNTAPSTSAMTAGQGSVAHATSPGNTAPSSTAMTPDTTPGVTASTAPAPDGAQSEAHVTTQGTSPGKTAPATSTQSSNTPAASDSMMAANSASPAPASPVMHHNYMSLPENGSVHTYLHLAKLAIRHHDTARADEALSRAETRLLTRAIPASDSSAVDQSPAITAIENARAALRSGDFATAASDTDMAMH